MSNLTNNTSELRDILATVNALPEASGGGGITPSGTKTITENGEGIDVMNYAAVNVRVPTSEPAAPKLQEKSGANSITPTKSQQTITPDSGYDGLSKVVVNKIPDSYIVPSGTKEITANGSNIDVSSYAKVNVAVPTGGSEPVETCTITLVDVNCEMSYVSVSGETVVFDYVETGGSIVVPKGAIVCALRQNPGLAVKVEGEARVLYDVYELQIFAANGDCTLEAYPDELE